MSPGAEKALGLLRRTPADGVSSYVLARSGVGDIRTAIAELEAGGYEIAREAQPTPTLPGLRYRLVSEPQLALVTDAGEVCT